MRTTLTLDEDVAEKAKILSHKLNRPFKQIINDALRYGLKEMEKPVIQKPYHTEPHKMGLREGYNLDNIGELLSHIDI